MDAFKETVLMTQNVAREASKQGIEMGRRESAEKIRVLTEALEHYAQCSDGCTCGDGWSHDTAIAALAKASA